MPASAGDGIAESECWRAGVCLCSAEGREVKSIAAAFMRRLKTAFPRGTPQFTDMLASQICVLLEGKAVEDDGPETPSVRIEVWHIAHVSLSPYLITLQNLGWDEEVLSGGRVQFDATGHWMSHYEAFAQLRDADVRWRFRFYRLDMSKRPIGHFAPARVSAYPMGEESSPLFCRRAPRRRPPANRPLADGIVGVVGAPAVEIPNRDSDASESEGGGSQDSSDPEGNGEEAALEAALEMLLDEDDCDVDEDHRVVTSAFNRQALRSSGRSSHPIGQEHASFVLLGPDAPASLESAHHVLFIRTRKPD